MRSLRNVGGTRCYYAMGSIPLGSLSLFLKNFHRNQWGAGALNQIAKKVWWSRKFQKNPRPPEHWSKWNKKLLVEFPPPYNRNSETFLCMAYATIEVVQVPSSCSSSSKQTNCTPNGHSFGSKVRFFKGRCMNNLLFLKGTTQRCTITWRKVIS